MNDQSPGVGHNSQIGGIAADALKQTVDRWERLETERKAIVEDQKDVLKQAGSQGFDVPTIRKILKLRKMEDADRMEAEQLEELYRAVFGL
jgi:uncharacterized protein (UPF0335 family)